MLAFDTETTGLAFQLGCTTFAIGVYDGSKYRSQTIPINPQTRSREKEFSKSLRATFDAADLLVAHNVRFDVKALCEAKLYDWQEPCEESFWNRFVDTGVLAHLYCSTDATALDNLTKKYLGRDYATESALVKTVDRCRGFVRRQNLGWDIGSNEGKHPSFKACKKNTQWNRTDYWLPAAILQQVPSSARPNISDIELNTVLSQYLRADVVNTFELAEFYFYELTERYADTPDRLTELLSVNRQIEHVLWKIELKGVWVRQRQLTEAIDACEHYINLLSKSCQELSGIEEITDAKLRVLFFDKWGMEPVKQTKGGQGSVDAPTLLALHSSSQKLSTQHTFLGRYLALKKYQKKLQFLSTYKNVTCNGFLNPSFKSVGTTTTRMSSENPNIQQVTKASNPYEEDAPDIAEWLRASPSMRSVFGPAPGMWWLDCDYSQLQLRIFAAITNEQEMMDAFDKGWDAHDFVARKIFGVKDSDSPTKAQRRIAKNVNFGFVFGASPKKIEQTAGVKGLWSTVTSLFPNAHAFIEETKKTIAQRGYIETNGGYPLELKDAINPYTGRMEKAAHAGVNYIVQGTEGVIVKRAMKLCDDYMVNEFPQGRIVLQCHDELVFEAPKYFPKKHVWNLTDLMEQAAADYGVKAPVEPELVTTCWDKSVKIRKGTK